MRQVLLSALLFGFGLAVGWFAKEGQAKRLNGLHVADRIEITCPTEDGTNVRQVELRTYRAARADGEGELTDSSRMPDGPEWIVVVNGVQHRCVAK